MKTISGSSLAQRLGGTPTAVRQIEEVEAEAMSIERSRMAVGVLKLRLYGSKEPGGPWVRLDDVKALVQGTSPRWQP